MRKHRRQLRAGAQRSARSSACAAPATWTKCARLFEKVRECARRRENAGISAAKVSQVKAQRLGELKIASTPDPEGRFA